MALIVCKDCKKEFSTDAKRCPNCGAKKYNPHYILKGLLILFLISWVLSQYSSQDIKQKANNNSNNQSQTDPIASAETILASDSTDTKAIVDVIVDLDRIKKEHGEDRYNKAQQFIKQLSAKREDIYNKGLSSSGSISSWSYFSDEDAMSSKNSRFASIQSSNTVNLGFPYSGEQQATLQLRTHPRWGKDVIFSVDKGQLLCSYSGCRVLVRFDEAPPVYYNANEPSDHSSTYLFISNYAGFVNKMSKAKKVRIAVDFYQNGTQTFEFNVSGFDQAQYSGKKL